MDRLQAMAVFLQVIDGGSLAAAGRKLGHSPAAVTRAVAGLEKAAGERLLLRTTRQLSVTEAGARHAATYQQILDELARLDARPDDAAVSGSVVVTAPELFGRLHVMPVVESFLASYPETRVRILLLNRMVDLVGEGVDVAIRLAALPDSSLTAVKVGEVRRLTCAAPAYLVGRPSPEHPSDLADHSCIGLNEAGANELWRYRKGASESRIRSVRVTCRLAMNSAAAAIEAAERGAGIVQPLSYQVAKQIQDGSLVALLEDFEPEPLPVHLVFQQGRGSGVVRAFIDHAVPQLRQAFDKASQRS